MELLTLTALREAVPAGRVAARLHVQIDTLSEKQTRDGKPYRELVVADAEGRLTLRAWSDSEAFAECGALGTGDFIELTGDFAENGAYGPDARQWTTRPLDAAEREQLLAGPPALRERQAADYADICQMVERTGDPRLLQLAQLFLEEYGARFRRTAAARTYHHARRGGLVEHVAQMMRTAEAIATVYPKLNRDLLVIGTLLHDMGKLWENALPENGFAMPYDERGEMLGHITIGIEAINSLWRKLLSQPEAESWSTLEPPSEQVRLHLLHLIAAHHGSLAFGSPVDPKTPEAHALHHLDNLDAKLEMIFTGYTTASPLAPRIYERVRPLPGNLIAPLPTFQPEETPGLFTAEG